MTLTCEVTDKTKAVTMWMTKSDGGPKMIADQFKLNFERANHSHSCVCECFDMHEGNGFRKYSRKVLVVGWLNLIIAFILSLHLVHT